MRQVREVNEQGPARSTVREWVASYTYGAGHLLLDALLRRLLALDPSIDLPDPPPQHVGRLPDSERSRGSLENAYTFWLLAEQLYALVKQR